MRADSRRRRPREQRTTVAEKDCRPGTYCHGDTVKSGASRGQLASMHSVALFKHSNSKLATPAALGAPRVTLTCPQVLLA